MLKRGDLIPHISVRRIDGTMFVYEDIWQRRNLLLVSLPNEAEGKQREATSTYIAALAMQGSAFQEYETVAVVTHEAMTDLPSPAVLIADRWGEIVVIESASDVTGLPTVDGILESVRFLAHACPECEGEAG